MPKAFFSRSLSAEMLMKIKIFFSNSPDATQRKSASIMCLVGGFGVEKCVREKFTSTCL